MRKKNKSIIMAMAVILAIATIASASTFAWYTAQDQEKNEFRNQQWDANGIQIIERFIPPEEWIPGSKVEKAVWAANVSDGPSVVRATLAEVLLFLDSMTTTTQLAPYSASALTPNTLGRDLTYAGTQVPKLASPAAYTSTTAVAAGWKPLTSETSIADTYTNNFVSPATTPLAISSFSVVNAAGLVRPAVAGDLQIFYKIEPDVSLITGEVTIKVEFAAVCLIHDSIGKYDGKYQAVSLAATKAMNTAGTGLEVVLTINGYETLPMGTVDMIKWEQGAALVSPLSAPYATWPSYTPGPTGSNFPLVPSGLPSSLVPVGTPPVNTSVIGIEFANYEVGALGSFTATTAMRGKWWYNTSDGYFYYLDVVLSGASTAEFVQSVTLTGNATNVHSDLAYDLYVFAQAMQPTAAAVDTWGAGISAVYAAAGVTLT